MASIGRNFYVNDILNFDNDSLKSRVYCTAKGIVFFSFFFFFLLLLLIFFCIPTSQKKLK